MKHIVRTLILLLTATTISAQVEIDGFVQSLYSGRTDKSNPTSTEYPASESRLQLRLEDIGDNGEMFARLDFLYDGADSSQYVFELREAYLKFRLGSNLDFKLGRQILTWGTGDLLFINDLFTKDYRSFFIGRDDQYLKAPQDAIRTEYYSPIGSFDFVWTPRFEGNRLPTGERLSYYNPSTGQIVGTGLGEQFLFDPIPPKAAFKNSEIAARFSRQLAGFNSSLYFYHGFYKNPLGARIVDSVPIPLYPRLNAYGFSLRGAVFSGVLWIEGGFFDSRDDRSGDNPLMPNSSIIGLIGFERQVATNLTANIQWQADAILDYDKYKTGQMQTSAFVRDEIRHLLTTRITKLLLDENLNLSSFLFYSPTDEDIYLRLSTSYKYSDEITIAAGGNIFDGNSQATEFGQFQKNDNLWTKATYNF